MQCLGTAGVPVSPILSFSWGPRGVPSMRSLLRVGVELISVVALTRWHLGGGVWPIGHSYAATPCRGGGYEAAAALYHVGPYRRYALGFKKTNYAYFARLVFFS